MMPGKNLPFFSLVRDIHACWITVSERAKTHGLRNEQLTDCQLHMTVCTSLKAFPRYIHQPS